MKNIFTAIINFFKSLFSKKEENEEPIVTNNGDTGNEIDENDENGNDINCQVDEPEENTCKIVILIDNGHGEDTAGKRSPYSSHGTLPEIEFYEYQWNREIANEVYARLKALGYDARLLVTELNDISLKTRVKRINKICKEVGKYNVLLVSIHANAAGNGKNWMDARGWCAFTTKGTTKSDAFSEYLYDEAEKNFIGHKIRTDKSDGDRDCESDFYIIHESYCPAVLTENFFYDNVEDVKYILSEEGKEAVIKTHVDGIINYINSLKS